MSYSKTLEKIFDNQGSGPKIDPNKIPFATELSSKASNVVASTDWVKNLATTSIYLAPESSGGSDTNDGMSEQTPVASLTKAVEIAYSLSQRATRIIVSPGSYTSSSSIELQSINLVLDLQGDASFSGDISLTRNSSLYIIGDHALTTTGFYLAIFQSLICVECGSWTHAGTVGAENSSTVSVDCSFTITSTSDRTPLFFTRSCYGRFLSSVDITASGTQFAIMIHDICCVDFRDS